MLYIDSANVKEVSDLMNWGIFKGVTTNQSIWLKSGQKYSKENYEENIRKLCKVSRGPVSVELTGTVLGALEEARHLFELCPEKVVIKVPMWSKGVGLRIISMISYEGIPVNATCLMTGLQAMLASEAGASYVSLFYNRMLEETGPAYTRKEFTFAQKHIPYECKLIAGSIRNKVDVNVCHDLGADIVTVTPKIIYELPDHPRTESTIQEFDKAWREYING